MYCKTRMILHSTHAWKSSQIIANHRKPQPDNSKRYQFTNPWYLFFSIYLSFYPSIYEKYNKMWT